MGHHLLKLFLFLPRHSDVATKRLSKKEALCQKGVGKKTQLDIRTTEVIDETPHARYRILLPALYATYILQLIVSIYFLFLSSSSSLKGNTLKCVQVIIMSIAWFVLSIGNTSTLSKVLKRKRQKKKEQ